jgi:hypothetical protein
LWRSIWDADEEDEEEEEEEESDAVAEIFVLEDLRGGGEGNECGKCKIGEKLTAIGLDFGFTNLNH